MVFEWVLVNVYGMINVLFIVGKCFDGWLWVMFSFYGGGYGGLLESDGFNYGNVLIFIVIILLMEILEVVYLVMFC